MNPLKIILLLAALCSLAPAQAKDYKVGDRLNETKAATKDAYRTITWDDLMPKDWDPTAPFKGLDLAKLKDSDPRAMEALAKMRKEWSEAPINPELNGKEIRIPGFVVSLDGGPDELREFLLVPYFGACIHVPPPPANQIIHVMPDKPAKGFRSMDTVWVSGVMQVQTSQTTMGNSGYVLMAKKVLPYTGP
ncbi:MAG: DUF3299 domain-containing protein [Parasulfuritortus sp.]|nr:DUF3299 domain-containing protein [Parasulfuritortus sp.]